MNFENLNEPCKTFVELAWDYRQDFERNGYGVGLRQFIYMLSQVYPDDAAEIVRIMNQKPDKQKNSGGVAVPSPKIEIEGCSSCPDMDSLKVMDDLDSANNPEQLIQYFYKKYGDNALEYMKAFMKTLGISIKGNCSLDTLAKRYFE